MPDKYIVLDIETHDPGLNAGEGSAWPLGTVEFLCAGTYELRTGKYSLWTADTLHELCAYLEGATHIIGHNIMYDIGVLMQSYVKHDFKRHPITLIDTLLLAKLYDNTKLSYSLDTLGKKIFYEGKYDEQLGQIALNLGLVKSKAQNPVKVAKSYMKEIYANSSEAVHKYLQQDIVLTQRLYEHLHRCILYLNEEAIMFYSDLQWSLLWAQQKGVLVDLDKARKVRQDILEQEYPLREELSVELPGVNLNSVQQLAQVFNAAGLALPRTAPTPKHSKGQLSVTSVWLNESEHPLAQKIAKVKKLEKLRRDFLEPLLEKFPYEATCVIHPEISIFGASATGRMSCSHPNIQQIPKRDKEFGSAIRSIYIPWPGEKWFSLDYSAQEPRLQVHFAYLIGAKGAATLVKAYKENPRTDLHQVVADIVGIDRNAAKTINLGLAYGMGITKLAVSLKVTVGQAKFLKGELAEKMPFLFELDKACQNFFRNQGYIKTLGSRALKHENGMEYKALNKLIQGSAADQTYKAMVLAYRAGIEVLFPVHDELCISTNSENTAHELQLIMENAYLLTVPTVVEVSSGPSWGECT